jgi:hypothetical protein
MLDGLDADRAGEMRFAGSRAADQHDMSMAPRFSSKEAPENSPVSGLAISHEMDRRLRSFAAALGA